MWRRCREDVEKKGNPQGGRGGRGLGHLSRTDSSAEAWRAASQKCLSAALSASAFAAASAASPRLCAASTCSRITGNQNSITQLC